MLPVINNRKFLSSGLVIMFIVSLILILISTTTLAQQDEDDATVALQQAHQADVGSSFTYQGRLTDETGQPANGEFAFQFSLFDSLEGGVQQGNTLEKSVTVVDGLFAAELNFGTDAFSGEARYLEISVKPSGSSDPFSGLSPRVHLTAVPYALGLRPGANIISEIPALYLENTTNDYDLVLGGSTADLDEGKLSTDPNMESSDLSFYSNDEIRFHLDENNDELDSSLIVVDDEDNRIFQVGSSNTNFVRVYGRILVNANTSPEYTAPYGARIINNGGAGIYARSNTNRVPDIILGAHDNFENAAGIIQSDPDYSSSGIAMVSNNGFSTYLDIDDTNSNSAFRVFIGDFDNKETIFQVTEDGITQAKVLEITGGSDLSESFHVQELTKDQIPEPGMVVCIDVENPGELIVCDSAYDSTVAGIISGAGGVNPGMVMGQDGSIADGDYPVALTGRVYVWADAITSAIQPGDLLTSANTPGHAMKATNQHQAFGAILGKAMTALEKGEQGLVLVLVSLQ